MGNCEDCVYSTATHGGVMKRAETWQLRQEPVIGLGISCTGIACRNQGAPTLASWDIV